ncbi:hypothetical protein RCIA96 [Methanocella arvoryzae MRE50]|uniref:Uncharacterized protein n=1 Tax=Methanocella arvoryzae (strain DSM 22066 / NBRC 105507 / MRE50) TaxID=351160 RepID=Q0W4T4_METAR|nr:hypothetical protein RCIA96 [Methanocella arvoryzae MRE50]
MSRIKLFKRRRRFVSRKPNNTKALRGSTHVLASPHMLLGIFRCSAVGAGGRGAKPFGSKIAPSQRKPGRRYAAAGPHCFASPKRRHFVGDDCRGQSSITPRPPHPSLTLGAMPENPSPTANKPSIFSL